jgi:nucleoside-diphosphate kinase
MERTLLLCKPDCVQRGLVGRVLARVEDKGLKIVGLRMQRVEQERAARMYAEHVGKDFYEPLLDFVTSGPLVAAVVEGVDAIAILRKLLGETFGPEASPGTIRGDFGSSQRFNLVHGSDSPASAEREIGLFFENRELMGYELCSTDWVYARKGDELI